MRLGTFDDGARWGGGDGRAPLIPRVLHQVAINTVLDPEIVANLAGIRALNPLWDCRLYDDRRVRDFIERHYGPRMIACYLRISPDYGAARADLFRYLVMYMEGGVYLDLKSFPERPFEEIIRPEDEFLLSRWANHAGGKFEGWGLHRELRRLNGGEFQQWFIIARPRHPFLRSVIARVVRNIERYVPDLAGAGRMGVLRTTGPIAYSLAIAPLLGTAAHRVVDSEADLGLNYSIYLDIDYTSTARGHYSRVSKPVVAISPTTAAFSGFIRRLKVAKRAITGAARHLARRAERPERAPAAVMDRGTRGASLSAPPIRARDRDLRRALGALD